MQRRFLVRSIILIVSLLASLCSLAWFQVPTASAHAFVIGSDPVDGSTISRRPEAARIFFNAPISSLSRAHVYVIRQGQLVDISSADSRVLSTNPRELVIPLQSPDKLTEGSYMILWSAVAQDDGHVTHGVIGFNIGFSSVGLTGNSTLGPGSSNRLADIRALDLEHFPNILIVLWDWLALIALAFWIAILVMELLVLADGGRISELLNRARKRTYGLQWLCLIVMLAGDSLSLFLRSIQRSLIQYEGNYSLSLLSDLIIHTDYGRIWLLRALLLLLAMGGLYASRLFKALPKPEPLPLPTPLPMPTEAEETRLPTTDQPRSTRKLITRDFEPATPRMPLPGWRERLAWLLVVALLTLLFVLTSPAQVLEPRPSALVFSWFNLIALGIWAGGFAYVVAILLPLFASSKELDYHTETLVSLQRRLTPFLLVGIGLQLVSSFFLSDASVRGFQQILSDPYGRTLIVLVALMGLMLLLSIYILFKLRIQLTRLILLLPVVSAEIPARRARQLALIQKGRRLRTASIQIAALGTGILLCMALMSHFAPPIVFPGMSTAVAEADTERMQQTKRVGDLTVTMSVLPGHMGVENTVVLLITDSEGQVVTDAEVRLNADMPAMDMGGPGRATITGGNPVYTTTFDKDAAFDMTGLWEINVEIQRPGQPMVQSLFQLMQVA